MNGVAASAAEANKGHLAVVTGASSGIGAAIARVLAARGLSILAIARRSDRLEALGSEIQTACSGRVYPLVLDLTAADAVDRIEREIQRIGAPLCWLVNNAGVGRYARFEEVGWRTWSQDLRLMNSLPMELTHRLLPRLRQAVPAYVLNVASVASYTPGIPGTPLYAAVKSSLLRFTEALSGELRGSGVTFTASCPGFTDTEIFEAGGLSDAQTQGYRRGQTFMSADQVAEEAVAAALRGDMSIIHGLSSRLAVFLFRHMPQAWARRQMAATLPPAPAPPRTTVAGD
ncbi:MAG: dehydrogenase [Hydrocarboniphaga sp.]|uniref:SDR family NAD(P)-dependent oxidoreductase n=1 Tax=Hydrocarboniphaga sp. TaxID=2033016 RepID=UPI00261C19B1|nr:SDR family NAD(P)-dependent oxidoreductase [Hydrocarboniphaga sp.]MDB5972310.1 dehydrogenase [Hydrocarboniphaga sp.]